MADHKTLTLSQVAQHKSKKDCWVVIHGRVLNVTKFLEEHPGGEEVILEVAGKDATKEFDDIGHSPAANKLLVKYQVGVLQGHVLKGQDVTVDAKEQKPKGMTAFVLKDGGISTYAAVLEFVVPVLAASTYFGYRYLTGATQMLS